MGWRWTALGACLLAACSYDLDALYADLDDREASAGAGDGGVRADAPTNLIDLWPSVSEACAACALDRCAAMDSACRAEPECVDATRCLSDGMDPATHAACRERHRAWFADATQGGGVGGPLYDCVFRHDCAVECGASRDWACLEAFDWPTTQDAHVTFDVQFVDALTDAPAAGATVRVCRPEDLACAAPASTVITDEQGRAQLELPTRPVGSFQGFLELRGEGWANTLISLGWPVSQDNVQQLRIVNEQSYQFNVQLSGEAPDPDRGLLQLRMFGCAGVGMEGVRFESEQADEFTRVWYFDGKAPSFEAQATFINGNGGMTNLPTGLNAVRGIRAEDGHTVAFATVPVRRDWLSIVIMAPLDRSLAPR